MNCNSYQILTNWGGESSDFEPRTNSEGDGDTLKILSTLLVREEKERACHFAGFVSDASWSCVIFWFCRVACELFC